MKLTKTVTITWTKEDIKRLILDDLARATGRGAHARDIKLFTVDPDADFVARIDIKECAT